MKRSWFMDLLAVVSVIYFGGILVFMVVTVTPSSAPIAGLGASFFGLVAGRVWMNCLARPKAYHQVSEGFVLLSILVYSSVAILVAITLGPLVPQLVTAMITVTAVGLGAYQNYH